MLNEFDYSDSVFLASKVEHYGYENICDEDLLEELQHYPRYIGAQIDIYERIKKEVFARELLVPTEVTLQERSDDWLAERRDQIRLEISALTRQEEALKAEREAINQEFVDRFRQRQSDGTRTSRFTVSLRVDDNYPIEEDRDAFEKYILKTKKLYLRQNRISMSAIQEELAVLSQEKEVYLKLLSASNYSSEACFSVLEELLAMFDDYHHLNPLFLVHEKQGTLKEFMDNVLNEIYTIPGISIVKKETINQIKKAK